ncbi:MAG: inorganic diphosphatase [Nanoarchaeota archaeon]|nr:inorganic diphosphatase [Nanoarchaeota archaeon]
MSRTIADAKEFLGNEVTIKIDRPFGSKHPKHGFDYPVNYGFVPGVFSGDGEELDAYVLGIGHAVEEFTGRCIAIVHRLDDDDDKLVVVPEGKELTDDQIREMTRFQEKWFKSVIRRE